MTKGYYITGVIACLVLALTSTVSSQTLCSIKVPVPNLEYCDAVGALEENVDGIVYEARGRVGVMKEYQDEAFKLFDQQFTSILNESSISDADMKDIEEEINTIKRALANIEAMSLEMHDEPLSDAAGSRTGRAKRAASLPPGQQQQLDAAKLSFQQSLAAVLQKLQNISQALAADDAKSTAFHARLQQEIGTNQRALSIVSQQLTSIDTDIQQTISQLGRASPTGSSVSLAGVQQSVTDMIINATVAEQLAQRQLDTLDKSISQMVADEASVTAGLATIQSDRTQFINDLDKDEIDIDNLVNGEAFVENHINTFIHDKTQDIADVRALLTPADQRLKAAGMSVAKSIIALGQFEQDLIPVRNAIDGTQTLVTLTKKSQQTRLFDILNQKKAITDSIKAMKYAFGLLTTFP